MCKQKVLSHNEHGYVVLCKNCQHYHIAFGTTVLSLSEIQYEEFKSQAQEQFNFHKDDAFPQQKVIQLPTFSTNVIMVLSFNELLKLIELIEEANILNQVDKLIYKAETKAQTQNNNT